ncbi:6-pyruvoyl trahydropterin synthase family protein [Enteractinococcus helveticum]|uniref:6-carboxy-5,6,7,8-tetrahydropterin synthase n=1 Tax=Enteractinococcus helveticum TaxID=1837282 RepID=A0A1B7M0J4_9MICC|nr:6-carboxytetrahydropterin synthase [Enteractinococcus helveticum]OAV61555.1 6-pyruvoyl tetrahydrobiopterin synthase [Enteractinococcus helveticum]
MFSLTVNDYVMIAHSLPNEFFGPAQQLHGATLTVEATFTRAALDEHSVVLDIGHATQLLDDALAPLRYADLDSHPDFAGRLSTTEVIAQYIGDALAASLAEQPYIGISVTLHENPRARVSYTVADRG